MRGFRILIIVFAISLSGLFCGGGGGSDAALEGGPALTPEDIAYNQDGQSDTKEDSVIVKEDEDSGTSEDGINDLANPENDDVIGQKDSTDASSDTIENDESDDTDEADTAENTGDTNDSDSTDKTGDSNTQDGDTGDGAATEKLALSLDSSQGRWKSAPDKSLDAVTKEEYRSSINEIKSLRNEIKDLRASVQTVKSDKTVSDEDKKQKIADLRYSIKDKRAQIKNIRAEIGFGRIQKGIYSPWAKEDLFLNAENVTKSGWYRLRIVAKNIYGPLPDDYGKFNITVKNETTGQDCGGIFIDARDDIYTAASTLIYLDEGSTTLNLLWTNDAYKKGEYDANIQIKKVSLRYAKNVNNRKKLVRTAHQYSAVDGRFFWDNSSVRTYWANQYIGFSFPKLEAGKYKVIVVAKNYGKAGLPDNYPEFKVRAYADGVDGIIKIKASDKAYKRGNTVLDLTGGDTELYLNWINDKYKKGVYDANIQIKKLILKRVGDSERSAVAAYLLGAKSGGNRLIILGIFLTAVMALTGLYFFNKRRAHV